MEMGEGRGRWTGHDLPVTGSAPSGVCRWAAAGGTEPAGAGHQTPVLPPARRHRECAEGIQPAHVSTGDDCTQHRLAHIRELCGSKTSQLDVLDV